jgi:hypothetical protein
MAAGNGRFTYLKPINVGISDRQCGRERRNIGNVLPRGLKD